MQSIQFAFNVQHDCHSSGCTASGTAHQRQERQPSDKIIHTIVHKEDTRFIINTHALHNASLLRKFLPRYLTVPRPLYPDRRKRHDELGKELVITEKARRVEIARKTAETKKKNATRRAQVVVPNAVAGPSTLPDDVFDDLDNMDMEEEEEEQLAVLGSSKRKRL